MKEEWLTEALQWPDMMVASDAMPSFYSSAKSAPNGAGSYTRLLARNVRELKVFDTMEAFRHSSYLPVARFLEFAPTFERKGRIAEGADADLLIFKLERPRDNATYTDPFREVAGWNFVIVGGEVVVEAGDPTGVFPGAHLLNRNE